MNTECGILSFFSNNEIESDLFHNSLKKLQHRGQESYGYIYEKNNEFLIHKNLGFIPNQSNISDKSSQWIGHVRYSTSGSTNEYQIQPFIGNFLNKHFCISHNGNLPFFKDKNTNDTIFLLQYIQKKINNLQLQNNLEYYFLSKNIIQFKKFIKQIVSIFQDLLLEIPGVYCILFSIFDITIAIRDRYGNRPLCLGSNTNQDFYCISSESIAFPEGINYQRDINPGEILLLYKTKYIKDLIHNNSNNDIENEIIIESYFVSESKQLKYNMKIEPKFCIFEIIYFMKQNSLYRFKTVEYYRKKLSNILAKKEIINFSKDTIVCGVPSTAILFGQTYAKELKITL